MVKKKKVKHTNTDCSLMDIWNYEFVLIFSARFLDSGEF